MPPLDSFVREIRLAFRHLARERTFAAVVVVTLGVCIGANVAAFSVLNAIVLQPLPYADANRIVTIYNSYPGAGVERGSNAAIDFFLRREHVEAFEQVAVYQPWGHTVGEAGSTERVRTMRVTASFFPLLGVEPVLGRGFVEDEMWPDQAMKIVLTHGYWQERLGGASDVVGRGLRVDGQSFLVVGVLPQDSLGVYGPDARFFVPIPFTELERTIASWHNNRYQMLGRLGEETTIEQAAAQIDALNASLIEESLTPSAGQVLDDVGYHTVVSGAGPDLVRDIRALFLFLWVGVALVFVIGCVNVANLMLARAHARLDELATRLALGARGFQLTWHLLAEGVVLTTLGSVVGIALGALGLRLLFGMGLEDLPRGSEIAIDGAVLAGTAVAMLGTAAFLGVVPTAYVMGSGVGNVLRAEGVGGTSGRRAVLLRAGLVTAQVALSFVLLVGTGLMFRSLRSAVAVDPGFEPAGLVTAEVSLPEMRYPDDGSQRRFADDLLAEVRSLAGVQAASVVSEAPFSGRVSTSVIFPEGYEPRPGESLLSPLQTRAGPGYFEAMGTEVLEGRGFEERDGGNGLDVVVIDEWLASRYWPGASPIGARMVYGAAPGDSALHPENMATVIGVVETVKHNSLVSGDHVGAYYFTYRQRPFADLTLVVRAAARTEQLPGALRQVLRRLDPELALYGVETMENRLAGSLAPRRAAVLLLGIFSAVALLLTAVGLYGALSYSVTRRRREMAIRVAMGSTPDQVFRIVLGHGLRVTVLGLLLGGVGAIGLARLARTLLFGVEPTDPSVLAGMTVLLTVVAAVACAVPAWHATRLEPSVSLRGD